MTRTRSTTLLATAALIPLTALALASCGGSHDATAATTPPKTANGQAATIGLANSGLGKILVDSQGHTLYLFKKDAGTKSSCYGECANDWPPLRANGKPAVGSGTSASTLGTTTRSDGKPQLTYQRHPLYLYEGDQKPGDTNGQALTAFGARWYALSPQGNQISGQPSSSSAGSSSGGSSGY
jgi:predicted lipoprotein with Yx(FWY)xxD motif